MSVLIEDLGSQQQQQLQQGALSPSRNQASDRNILRLGTKRIIRLDSPTTTQACNELGIFVDDLRQKTIEDFKDTTVEESLVQLRFNHYIKRYNQALKDVAARKRQITRRLRNQQLETQNLSPEPRKSTGASPGPLHFSGAIMTTSAACSPYNKTTTPLAPLTSSPIAISFNKTVTYLRKCHTSAEVKDLDEIVGTEDIQPQTLNSPLGSYRKTLSEEVLKFNKIKKQKQLEAKESYDSDLKRIKLLEEEKDREERRKEKERKLALEKKRKEDEKKRINEEKTEKIREIERNYVNQKEEEKQKMREKLELARKKFEQEVELRRRAIAEQEMKMEQKMKEARDRRAKLREEELKGCDQLKADIDDKIYSTEGRHQMNLHHKSKSVKARINQVEETVSKNKEKQKQESEAYVQKLTNKLVKDEENIRGFKEKYFKDLKKKEADIAEKDKRLEFNQKDLDGQHHDRMAEINERFRKVQENLETKREIDDKNRKLKGELNRLKLMDKLENHSRLQRRLQFERLKILDKEKYEQEKVYWLKSHREFAQKAKLEVAIQSKIEKDAIEDGMNHLSKLVYGAATTRAVTDSQKRVLRKVLQPEDYKDVEELEKKREAEKKAKLGQVDEINSAGLLQMKKKNY